MAAAEFTDHNENLIDIGTDYYVIVSIPGDLLHVYRNGRVTSENSGRTFQF